MKNTLYLNLVLMSILASCNYHNNTLSIQKTKKNISINQFGDSSFFCDIRSVAFYKNKFFVSDYNRDNIFILNRNLKLEKTLGNKGKGPGELLGASHLFLYQDSIFIINDGKKTIEVFNFNNYLATFNIPKQLNLSSDIRFCLHKGKILSTNFNSSSSLSMLSLKSDSITWFGKLKEFESQKETRTKNKRHVQIIDDKIIALPDCQATLELYNMNGELLNVYDFRHIDIINKLLRFTENKSKSANSYYQLFPDFYVYENQIFIQILSINKNGKIQCNKIIQFEMVNNNITPKNILSLGNGWFGPFCVAEKKILTFNQTNAELILYDYE